MTIAGGGDVSFLFFSFFCASVKQRTGRGNEATDAVFPIGNYESCTRPISTNPGSINAGEHRLTRWTCSVSRRLEVVSVAGLLWIPFCVLGGAIL